MSETNLQILTILEKIFLEGKLVRDDSQIPYAKELITALCQEISLEKDLDQKDVRSFLVKRIQDIDNLISLQLNEVLHHPEFQKLEGSWLGLRYLVSKTETSQSLKIRVLNIKKSEIFQDLTKAVEVNQSFLFKKIYEEEYGTFGGVPYSCLVGDFYFGRHPQDIEILEKISAVAASAHSPFLTSANPKLFDLESFENLGNPRDLSKIFQSVEMAKWNSFRAREDSRYLALCLPRVLMRLPYSRETSSLEGICFDESINGKNCNHFCWGNAAYVLAERITNAFEKYGWTAAIRGVEGGGIVEDLPAYTFKTFEGDIALRCPTELSITDRRERELNNLGFISLCHCKGTDYAAFFGCQTVQKPKLYENPFANANAALSARLSYILVTSRFAHYIKVMMRDKVGSFVSRESIEDYLNTWIASYVLLNDDAPQSIKAHYPLREARIDVSEDLSQPGSYQACVYLRPHFQMEELTVSIRLVTKLPSPAR